MALSLTKLKTISKKVEAKLNKVIYKLHMKKPANNKAGAGGEIELIKTATNAEHGNTIKPALTLISRDKSTMPEPAVETKVIGMELDTTTKPIPTNADLSSTNKPEITVETEGINSVVDKQQGTITKLMPLKDDQATTTNTPETVAEAEPIDMKDIIRAPVLLFLMCIGED